MNLNIIKRVVVIRRQTGVSMIEALVSLLIFTIGALGMAALQLSSLSISSDNEQRSLAVWKAQEFADRIKSSPGLEGAYIAAIGNSDLATNSLGADSQVGVFICPAAVPTDCSAAGADCSDAEIVAYDIWEVFCQANTGIANTPNAANQVFGSSGFNQLEVILRQLPEDNDADGVDDATGDIELYFEWVSNEGDNTENITNTNANGSAGAAITIKTSLCGFSDLTASGGADTRIDMNSRLDAYCMRFR